MTVLARRSAGAELARRLAHVRWVAGGTGAGKSTAVRLLAQRHDLHVYDGDAAEQEYAKRCSAERHPLLWELLRLPVAERWVGRTGAEVFQSMPSLHGETFGFILEDLLTLPADRIVLVDDYRVLPRDIAALLAWPDQATFLLPTAEFRRKALADQYADPDQAAANWGDADPAEVLEVRLARDQLWDAEVRRQAEELAMPVITVDGSRTPEDLAADLTARFRLTP
jgi:hypothetical protein